eukprot:15451335-Alexandrium_andersonii.AAC.1
MPEVGSLQAAFEKSKLTRSNAFLCKSSSSELDVPPSQPRPEANSVEESEESSAHSAQSRTNLYYLPFGFSGDIAAVQKIIDKEEADRKARDAACASVQASTPPANPSSASSSEQPGGGCEGGEHAGHEAHAEHGHEHGHGPGAVHADGDEG